MKLYKIRYLGIKRQPRRVFEISSDSGWNHRDYNLPALALFLHEYKEWYKHRRFIKHYG